MMLRIKEVADILGLHPSTVKRIPPSELPYYRVTKRGDRRYRKEDVLAYLASRRTSTPADEGEADGPLAKGDRPTPHTV